MSLIQEALRDISSIKNTSHTQEETALCAQAMALLVVAEAINKFTEEFSKFRLDFISKRLA